MTGSELLDEARHLHPHAKRGLLIPVASAVGEGLAAIQLFHRLFAAERLHPSGRPTEPTVAARS